MRNLIIVTLLLGLIQTVSAGPIDFDNLQIASISYGRVAGEHRPRLLATYNNKIYFIVLEDGTANPSKVYCYDPSDGLSNAVNHTTLAETTGQFVMIRQIGNLLYFSDNLGNVYVYDGNTLTTMSGTPFTTSDHVSSIVEFNGLMYFATSTGNIYRYDGLSFVQVGPIGEDRNIIDMVAWQKDGYLYVSVGNRKVCCPPTGYLIRSSTGDPGSWATVFSGFWGVYQILPTADYLYAAVVDTAYSHSSTIRKSSDGTTFPPIYGPDGQYKRAWGSFYYNGIAYFFTDDRSYGFGERILDDNGSVSRISNQNWTLTQAVALNGEVYALASSSPGEFPGDVYLITTAPEPACDFSDDFEGTALDTSLWSVFVDGLEYYHWPYVADGLLHSQGYHTRIDSIPTFAPMGQSVMARARIRFAGDIQKFGFAPNPNERDGPITGYYFDTLDRSLTGQGEEHYVWALAWFQPASGDLCNLLGVKIPVPWYEFHEFAIERTPSEVIYSIDGQEVARVADAFAGALPVGVWNDRWSLMQTDWVEAVCEPAIIYVDTDAIGTNDGSNWADAFNHLQDALSVARFGDEIWVAGGIYRPDEDTANPTGTGNRTATFQLKNGVGIYGGYAGFSEPDPDVRDFELYETMLSGDLNGDDIGFTNNGENSYHVVAGSGTGETAVLDGFTITGGNAHGKIAASRVGGGMYNNSGSPTLANCTFSGNSARTGGGMYNDNSSSPTVTNCTFSGNSASPGDAGGMRNIRGSSPTVVNCTFSGNWSGLYGGAINNFYQTKPNFINCTFIENSADYRGGAMFNNIGLGTTVTNCIMWGNTAPRGAQIYNNSGRFTVTYSDVQGGWPGEGNINADPCFVDADGSDNIFGTEDDNLHLLPDSPCIDVGDNTAVPPEVTTDLDGNPRIINGIVDMGAYEYANNPPDANAGPGQTVEQESYDGTLVTLDGSGSTDPDSTEGTNDDIVYFDWFEGVTLLGSGEIINYTFSLGSHTVTLVVTDGFDETDDDEVIIVVQDTAPPVVNAGSSIRVEQETYEGTTVALNGSAIDNCDAELDYQWSENGVVLANSATLTHTFNLGIHTLTLKATDDSSNVGADTITVTVVDTTPPVITINGPAVVILECGVDSYTELGATATDICDPDVPVIIGGDTVDTSTCGTYVVTYDATDASGNPAEQLTRTVTVQDTTPPDFEFSVTPDVLWPANHKMVLITPSWTVSDICDESPEVSLVSIVMNEGDDAIGDGHTSDDIQVGDDGSIYLRAERSGTGVGRIYTITYQAVDDSGNATVQSATVTVPHDQRKSK